MRFTHKPTKTRTNYSDPENVEAIVEIFKQQWILEHVKQHHPEIIKLAEQKASELLEEAKSD